MKPLTDMDLLYALGTLPGVLDGAQVVVGHGQVYHLAGKAIDEWREMKNTLSEERKAELKTYARSTYFEGKNEEGQIAWLHREMAIRARDEGGVQA